MTESNRSKREPIREQADDAVSDLGDFGDPMSMAHARNEIKKELKTAALMLSKISVLSTFDSSVITDRLNDDVLARVYRARNSYALSLVGVLAYFAAFLSLPCVLMIFSEPKHSVIIFFLLYIASLVVSLVFTIIGIIVVFIALTEIVFPHRPILWAWEENDNDLLEAKRNRWKAVYILAAVVLVIAAVAVGSAELLRRTDFTFFQFIGVVALAPILTSVAVFIVDISTYISRPRAARIAQSLAPGDAVIVDVVNLAFLTDSNRTRWQQRDTLHQFLAEYELAAKTAEFSFPGLYRKELTGDSETMMWARDQSAGIAATFRIHKRELLVATSVNAIDTVTSSLCHGLTAACKGNWAELTEANATLTGRSRIKRWLRVVASSIFLAVASVLVPFTVHPVELRSTVRIYLIVAAILALVTAVNPESQKAADTIQGILGKITEKSHR